jgi:hypothetical protein
VQGHRNVKNLGGDKILGITCSPQLEEG